MVDGAGVVYSGGKIGTAGGWDTSSIFFPTSTSTSPFLTSTSLPFLSTLFFFSTLPSDFVTVAVVVDLIGFVGVGLLSIVVIVVGGGGGKVIESNLSVICSTDDDDASGVGATTVVVVVGFWS